MDEKSKIPTPGQALDPRFRGKQGSFEQAKLVLGGDKTRKSTVIATTAIMGSRLFGLIREQVFAFFFGASAALDAFVVAFRIPNLLRDLFAEGALSQSFVTVFSQKLATEHDKSAFDLANKVSTFIILLIGPLVILGEIFTPQLVHFLAEGFSGEKFDLTVQLTRILLPFILFACLAALLMGMLNAKNKFFLPQSASTFFNITSIVAGLLFAYWLSPDYIVQTFDKFKNSGTLNTMDGLSIAHAIAGMAWGTLLGGIVQHLIQMPALMKLGYRLKLDFNFRDSSLIKVLKLTGPAVIGGAAVQVNVLVNTYFASFLSDGSVSYLNYAFRLMQFPLGVFGVAVATVSAPTLAKMIAQKREEDFKSTIRSSLQMSLYLSIPSAVGLIVLAYPVISLIYEHGRFDTLDAVETAYALMAYALGVTSYSLIKIYQPAFLSFHDAKTPMIISLLSILINFSVNWYFIRVAHFSHWSLALGTAIVATLNLVFLIALFRKKVRGIWSQTAFMNFAKVLFSAGVMGAFVWYVYNFLVPIFDYHKFTGKLPLAFIPIILAVPVYLGTTFLFKVPEALFFVRRLFRQR